MICCGGSLFTPVYAHDGVRNEADVSGLDHKKSNNDFLAAVSEMAHGYADPYFEQLSPDELEAYKLRQYSDIGDLGFDYCITDSGSVVITAISNVELLQHGIEAGDSILAVNDVAVNDLTEASIEKALVVPSGQNIKLAFYHAGRGVETSFSLKSKRVLIQTVTGRVIIKRVGYIRISTFLPQTPMDLRKRLDQLVKQAGDGLQGFIIDLRDNSGGSLQAAVDSTDLLLDDGVIATILDRDGKVENLYSASRGDITQSLPIVLLINGNTASAAELFAAALQDNKRALILGTRSFGKDTIQITHELDGGGAIKLTTARYLTPSGQLISFRGIHPDIVSGEQGSILGIIARIMDLSADKKSRCCDKDCEELLTGHDASINKAVNLLKLRP